MPSERRDEQVVFRINCWERQALEGLARNQGLLVSEYLRALLGEAALASMTEEMGIR